MIAMPKFPPRKRTRSKIQGQFRTHEQSRFTPLAECASAYACGSFCASAPCYRFPENVGVVPIIVPELELRKATWLYAFGVEPPALRWGSAPGEFIRLDEGYHSTEERIKAHRQPRERLSADERIDTPLEFRDALISIAVSAFSGGQR